MSEEIKVEVCDCEHDHDECDCGCEHDEDVVVLEDEDGNEIPFHYVTTLEHEGKEYVYLQAADADEDDLVIEVFELETVEEDGETYDRLFPVDDDLYEVLYNKLMEEVAHECDGEEECDCGCHHHE